MSVTRMLRQLTRFTLRISGDATSKTLTCAAGAQNAPSFQGETALKTQFVEVQSDVKLEVLDWGGTGRNLVLLAGLGSTAHVFDSLGPKLAAHYHVIGITRRGFGQSSVPQTGYDPKRFGDDVVAVLDTLHIVDPVLIGHSIAGEELSSVSTYHPGRAAALVYLDAGAPFALYNPKYGDYTPALAQLRNDLSELQKDLFDDGLVSKTLRDTALFQANLANLRAEVEGGTGPSPKCFRAKNLLPSLFGEVAMPQYVIEREIPGAGNLSDAELQAVARKSVGVLKDMGPEIKWLHSYVTGDKVYCVYLAPDEETVREHARRGGFPANRISAVRRLIDPNTAN